MAAKKVFFEKDDLKRFVVRFAFLKEPFWLTWKNHIDEESSRNKEFAHANIFEYSSLIEPNIRIGIISIRFSTIIYTF